MGSVFRVPVYITDVRQAVTLLSENGFSVTMTEDCEITFSNRASGLTDIDVSKLFDRFFTVDPSRRSTGLGLSIAKALVEQMGGVIFADYSGEILSITVRFD